MTDELQSKGAIDRLVDGGLPQLLLGPAGSAISRLISAAIEIPATWLDGVSQGNRDRNEGRSVVMKALAQQASEIGATDPVVMDRAMKTFLGRVDKRDSPGAVIVIQAGICNGDQRGTKPDVERRVGVL
ncbi:hypothetical protein LO749_18780 [Paracoccus denitrificans]|uniref:hypothetical protein n=1 Tax=Paracoccus denitrificans TaxID=266 RepID=UPI001E5B8F76|nr:hypothetical protein [Paracoccus denitrificans]UFS66553.1 hypothetical protein LO749_18780 [Paracoccus denitrificans]